jgi:uncharacterized membrane protein YgcG
MKTMALILAGWSVLVVSGAPAVGQDGVPPPEYAAPMRSPPELEQLVGPIALYPDPLIAEILPASTFPSQIVMADRYLSEGGDPSQIPQQPWDPSIQALAHYANVLKWMDDNLPWTTQLGQAFENQQADVMDAVQRLRGRAQSLGNLPSTPQENVVTDEGDIDIEPTDPAQMYVPTYDPDQIYYQPGVYCSFGFALPIGGWLPYDWDWHHHGMYFWGPGHERPHNWWHLSPHDRGGYITAHPLPVWHVGGEHAVTHIGWERGYATARASGPLIVNVRSAPIGRQPAIISREPAFRSEPARSEPIRSAPDVTFIGGQSGREAAASSFRGQASRAAVGGGGGGGGHAFEAHGFGGGGGGGGSHGGGGGKR